MQHLYILQYIIYIYYNIFLLKFFLIQLNISFIKKEGDQLRYAICGSLTNTTMFANVQYIMVEEWDAILQPCVAGLVISMRRK